MESTHPQRGRVLSVSSVYPKKHNGLWKSTKYMSDVLRAAEVTKSEVKKEKPCQTRGPKEARQPQAASSPHPEPGSGRGEEPETRVSTERTLEFPHS